jgi:hypothetical protein
LLAAAVLAAIELISNNAAAGSLQHLRVAYNEDVRRLNAGKPSPLTDNSIMSPGAAVRQFELGLVDLKILRQASKLPSLGAKFAVRGRMVVSDAEEMVAVAAPKRIRIVGPPAADGRRAFVPLELSSLDGDTLTIIVNHCGVVACDVTVSGQVGEVEAERVTNPFSAAGVLSMMIGMVAEDARFHEIKP